MYLIICVYAFFVFPIENDTIYWTDMGLNKISRAKRDQTWKEDIVTNGLGRVEGIAIDWIAGKIYGFFFYLFSGYIFSLGAHSSFKNFWFLFQTS